MILTILFQCIGFGPYIRYLLGYCSHVHRRKLSLRDSTTNYFCLNGLKYKCIWVIQRLIWNIKPFTFLIPLSKFYNPVHDNLAQVSWYSVGTAMWFIFKLAYWIVPEDISYEGEGKMIWRANTFRLPRRHKFILLQLCFDFYCDYVGLLINNTSYVDTWIPQLK